jgi:RimJ/RimL family protein N-acetyltransferase
LRTPGETIKETDLMTDSTTKEHNPFMQSVLQELHSLKYAPRDSWSLEFRFKDTPYRLVPLTLDHCDDMAIVEILAAWREKHAWWFPAQFKVTVEGTARWLRNGVVETPDRLLFMVSVNETYLGHVGLFRFEFEERTCEIDNIVRGEPGYPGLIGDAIANMMRWGSNRLGLKGYTLQTFSDNERSLSLYGRLGFREVKRVPLLKIEAEDKVEWVDAPADYRGPVERSNVFMVLSDTSYLQG